MSITFDEVVHQSAACAFISPTTYPLSTTPAAGQLIFIGVQVDSLKTASIAGYTQLETIGAGVPDRNKIAVFYKESDGTEVDFTLTSTTARVAVVAVLYTESVGITTVGTTDREDGGITFVTLPSDPIGQQRIQFWGFLEDDAFDPATGVSGDAIERVDNIEASCGGGITFGAGWSDHLIGAPGDITYTIVGADGLGVDRIFVVEVWVNSETVPEPEEVPELSALLPQRPQHFLQALPYEVKEDMLDPDPRVIGGQRL
jgi:hypothetical protein